MDAKSRANFINSVAAGETIPCPTCNAANKPGAKFCLSCGTELKAPAASAPAFSSVEEAPAAAEKYSEPVSAFAEGLPTWDIVPPQVMVRRR